VVNFGKGDVTKSLNGRMYRWIYGSIIFVWNPCVLITYFLACVTNRVPDVLYHHQTMSVYTAYKCTCFCMFNLVASQISV
jgi:hypothetical protein